MKAEKIVAFSCSKANIKPSYQFTFLTALIISFLFSSLSYSHAVPTSTFREQIVVKQIELEKVRHELSLLETELEIIGEAYHGAQWELEQTQAKLAENQMRYKKAQENFEFQSELLSRRVKTIYVLGEVQFFEVLLNTTSFKDFLLRLRFLFRIGESDARLIEKVNEEKEELEKLKEGLEELRGKQKTVKETLEAKKIEREMKIAEQENYLKSISKEIKILIEQERLVKERERLIAKEDARKLFNLLDINVPPGSVLETTLLYLGVPYVWAGEDPVTGFDCSGLMKYAFEQHGVYIPHYSGAQFMLGEPVQRVADLQAGDLVFFGHPIHHVGMYVDKDYFVHAPQSGDYVRISRLSERIDYAGARRIEAPLIFERQQYPTSTYPLDIYQTPAGIVYPPQNPIIEFPSSNSQEDF